MRPDRAVVKKAIQDAAGNLSRAAALLGCSRTTLYTWIYQLGLERLAGIRPDRRDELDTRERQHSKSDETKSQLFNPSSPARPILRAVEAMQAPPDIPIQATMKLPESLWKRVKIEAIREGCTVSEYVRRTLASSLGVAPKRARNGKQGDEGGRG